MDQRHARVDAYEKLEARISRWLGQPKGRRGRIPRLSERDVRLIRSALVEGGALAYVLDAADSVNERVREAERAYYKKGPKAAARAMGWSTGKSRSKRPYRLIVEDYISLMGIEPHTWWKTLGGPTKGKPALSPAEALKVVSERYGFPSATACRTSLIRQREKLRAGVEGTHELSGLIADFSIPDPSQL